MSLRNGRRPANKVNIGVGKDTLNDFARKYNLEVDEIFDILNQDTAKKIVFYSTSEYWSAVTGGYKLSIPHNGNIVFAVYRTDSATESTQVLTGVSMDSTNVNVESVDKFSGYLLCAALNDDIKHLNIGEDGSTWNAEEKPISNIGGPVDVHDAATKDYVDRLWNNVVLEGGSQIVIFDNVAQMVDASLESGQTALTKGYYSINDGGGALYNIRAAQVSDVGDGGSIIFLDDNTIVAELFTNGVVNVKQFGAVGDGVEDDTTAFQNTSSFASSNNQIAVITPATYKVTEDISGTFCTVGTVTITGDGTVTVVNFKDEADIASASAELAKKWANYTDGVVADSEESAKKYATDAGTSATSAYTSATNAQNLYNALIAQGGHPFQAATVADMTDTTKIYVYTGSETGYTNGDWYYYNGSAWVSGGVYNAVAFNTDTTLFVSGDAADAKVTGDYIRTIRGDIYSQSLLNWHKGVINSSSGVINSSSTSGIYTDYISADDGTFVVCGSGYKFRVFAYNNDDTYVGGLRSDYTFAPGEGSVYVTEFNLKDFPSYKIRIELRKEGGGDIATSDGTNCKIIVYTVNDSINTIENVLEFPHEMTWAYTDKKYIKTDVTTINTGSPYTTSNSYHGKCNFMACNPGDVFIVSTLGDNKFRPFVICSSDGTIIQWADNRQYHNERIVIPSNGAYIGFNSVPTDAYGTVMVGEYVTDKMQHEIDALPISSPYDGAKGVAFGTSLTARGSLGTGYLAYLPDLIGATIDNQGVGSSYWRTWHESSSNILYNVQHYNGYADKDFCIIEGCVNDWAGDRTLGTYKDTGTDTVCGCLYNMISHIYTQNPNIQIFVILDHFGRLYNSTDNSPTALNGDNLTQYDFYEEIAKCCKFNSIPCIKEYAISSIGIWGTQYLDDNIHLNSLGAQQSAKVIAKAMQNLTLKVVSA